MKSQAALLGVRQATLFPGSDLWQYAAVRPLPDNEVPLAEHQLPRVNGGDFSRVPVHASGPNGEYAGASCPLTPRRCPFGGACHTCPTHIQAKHVDGQAADSSKEVPPIVHEMLRSPGHPLDPATRAFFEPRFGHDFGRVRVHTDAQAAESARAVNALAYTIGSNVAFDSDQYAPQTLVGRLLLAHELTHVLQQRSSTTKAPTGLDTATTDHEREAEAVSMDILSGRAMQHTPPVSASVKKGTVQRGFPLVIAGAAALAAGGVYAIWAYNCLKECERPMHVATFGTDIRGRTGGFRLWYYNQTRAPVPGRVWDAFGHCFVACCGTKRCGATATAVAGKGREFWREYLDSDPHDSYEQDTNNQTLGRDFGNKGMECSAACRNASISGLLDLTAPITEYWAPETGGSLAPIAGLAPSLRSDTDIRYWLAQHNLTDIGAIPVREKIRMINRLLDGWISDDDVAGIARLCRSVTSAIESAEIRRAISSRESSISDLGQRTRVRYSLQEMP